MVKHNFDMCIRALSRSYKYVKHNPEKTQTEKYEDDIDNFLTCFNSKSIYFFFLNAMSKF